MHHFMVILCYTIAAASKTYVSYAALSLVVEINSIFLHARQVILMFGDFMDVTRLTKLPFEGPVKIVTDFFN